MHPARPVLGSGEIRKDDMDAGVERRRLQSHLPAESARQMFPGQARQGVYLFS